MSFSPCLDEERLGEELERLEERLEAELERELALKLQAELTAISIPADKTTATLKSVLCMTLPPRVSCPKDYGTNVVHCAARDNVSHPVLA